MDCDTGASLTDRQTEIRNSSPARNHVGKRLGGGSGAHILDNTGRMVIPEGYTGTAVHGERLGGLIFWDL